MNKKILIAGFFSTVLVLSACSSHKIKSTGYSKQDRTINASEKAFSQLDKDTK